MNCSIAGCVNAVKSSGLCSRHYERKRLGQDLEAPGRAARGEGTTNKDGYKVVGAEYEHREVMEKKLGRRLLSREVVHHIDEDTSNNHPDSLEVYSTPGEHAKAHRRKRALEESGHASWLKCRICCNWADPDDDDSWVDKTGCILIHRSCNRQKQRERRALRNA